MLKSYYKQNGNSQTFSQSVLFALYLDISWIYMLLTLAVTPPSIPDFLCIYAAFLPKHSLHCRRNTPLSRKYALSKNVFINNSDIFPRYDMLYNSSSDLQFYWWTLPVPFLSCNEYGLYPFPCIWLLHDAFGISRTKAVLYHPISVLIRVVSFCIYIRILCGIVIIICAYF